MKKMRTTIIKTIILNDDYFYDIFQLNNSKNFKDPINFHRNIFN